MGKAEGCENGHAAAWNLSVDVYRDSPHPCSRSRDTFSNPIVELTMKGKQLPVPQENGRFGLQHVVTSGDAGILPTGQVEAACAAALARELTKSPLLIPLATRPAGPPLPQPELEHVPSLQMDE